MCEAMDTVFFNTDTIAEMHDRIRLINSGNKEVDSTIFGLMPSVEKNSHHVVATSRGGSNDEDNLVKVAIEAHTKFHQIFGSATVLLPKEQHEFLDVLHGHTGETLNGRGLHDLRKIIAKKTRRWAS